MAIWLFHVAVHECDTANTGKQQGKRGFACAAFAAGDAFSIADITGLVAMDFMKPAKILVPDEFTNVRRWHADISSRESAKA